jgi:hypothetical protein
MDCFKKLLSVFDKKPAPTPEPVIGEREPPEQFELPLWMPWIEARLGWSEITHDKELAKGRRTFELGYCNRKRTCVVCDARELRPA